MTIGRNDACPCGSGKKYKKCCIPKYDKYLLTLSLLSDHPTNTSFSLDANSNIQAQNSISQLKSNLAHLWIPDRLEHMSDEEILGKLNELQISITREQIMEDLSSHQSTDKVRILWETRYNYNIPGFDADFPYCAIIVLWKRWFPDRPSIEMLDEMYSDMFDPKERGSMVTEFRRIWTLLKENFIIPLGFRSFDELHNHFDMEFDTESILFEAQGDFVDDCDTIKNPDHRKQQYDILIDTYRDIFSLLPEINEHNRLELRRTIGEIQCSAEDYDQAGISFQQLTEEYPSWVWGYVSWGMMYDSPRHHKSIYSPERTADIYRLGIERCIEDVDVLQERLEHLSIKKDITG
ncbi:MAG: SEC-C metal-binding domain-containing protein [Paenibacillaceae bacterium]